MTNFRTGLGVYLHLIGGLISIREGDGTKVAQQFVAHPPRHEQAERTRSFKKNGSLEKEERKRQEVWTVTDPRVSHLIVGFDPDLRGALGEFR